jgi:hypothetical protein
MRKGVECWSWGMHIAWWREYFIEAGASETNYIQVRGEYVND